MQRDDLIWLPEIEDKIGSKHQVECHEVEEVFLNDPVFFRGPKGHRPGENVYYALGQTDAGRYLYVIYIKKRDGRGLILSARDMTDSERRRFARS